MSRLEAAKKLIDRGIGSLTLKQIRSFGTPTKINPNQVKIGDVKSGLYYDKDLPFIHKIPSVQASGKHKGKKDTKYRLRSQGPEDLIMVHFWEGGKQVFKPMKRKDLRPVKDPKTGKIAYRRHEGDERIIKKEKVTMPLLKRIVANPGEFGLKGTMKNTKDILPIVNKELVKSGYKPINQHTLNIDLFKVQGKQVADVFKGTAREKELHKFLREINPKTGKPRFHTIVISEIKADPRFKDLSDGVIKESRLRGKLNRPIPEGYRASPLEDAQRRIKNKLKEKYPDMSKEEIAAYNEQARILLNAPEHSANFSKRLYNERYTDKDVDTVVKFIERTDMPLFRSGQHPEMEKYMAERALNQLRSALSGETYTMGHMRRKAGDTWWLSGLESETMAIQKGDINRAHLYLDMEFQSAIKRGDIKTAEKVYKKMIKKGIRSSMVDEFGEQIFYGAPRQAGKMAEGGLVNGYNKGGKVIKLLDDAIGMMSRRKFLKGMGATAASTALPKSALKLAPAVIKKGALNFAPPWVNGMLSSLKGVKTWSPTLEHAIGNNAKVINLGSRQIKLYKDQTATETHFKVKTGDQVTVESMVPMGKKQDQFWDDIVLTEEKGQTTITFKNKEFDHGNDQHIVIDKISKETRFVDDNWQMEPGGGDIIKDDWIEYVMNTDKKKLAREMGLAKGDEIGESLVDEWSVSGLDNSYSGMFESFVDSFSPSGNIFGTVAKLKNALIKPKPITKKIEDMYEEDMMKWEGQFRGGQGIHGYKKGGLQRGHHQKGRQPKYNTEKLMNAIGMAETSPAYMQRFHPGVSRLEYKSPAPSNAYGQYGLRKENYTSPMIYYNDDGSYKSTSTSRSSAGYRMPLLSESQWNKAMATEAGQRNLSQMYLQNMANYYQDNPLEMLYGKDPYYEALLRYGPETGRDTGDYFNKYKNKFAGGGIARRPNAVPPEKGPDPYATFINDSVSQIRSSPSEFMGSQFIQKFNKGGFVKRNAPKVLGKITNYRPKLTMSDVLKNIQKAKKKNTIGLTQTEKKAAILGDVKPEESGALFWGSREKIIGAPSEAMTGTQWLQYMKLPKHGILNPKGYPVIKDMELNDTSLAPWLSRMGNKTVSKPDLVRQFDEMAPTMDVVALGDTTGGRIISDLASSLKKIDTQAIRNPAIKGFYDYLKAVMPQLKDSTTSTESKAIIKYIDEMVYNNFGVKDALTEGVPQRFPFEIKEVLQSLSTALGKRTAGFKTYRRQTQHEGTQMMEGGENYREFLFRHTPGSLRQNEPGYKYAHDFNLSSVDRAGGVVHARTSDRGDQFGRRLLHIEEIQSDMHQKINAAQRKVKKQIAEWEKQGLKPHEAYLKLSTRQRKEFDELTASSKYAPRGDMKEEIGTANEQHLALIVSKVEDLLAQPQTKQIVARLTKLKRERTKVRKMIKEEQAKMAAGDHSGVPQGPLSKTEDYNEFIMKYLLRVAREGGYDGLTINTAAIKNKGLNVTNQDYRGNLVAYGPMAKGAMEKAAKKSGAKFMKTYIMDGDKKVWEVPMILFKENKAAQAIIDKGLPIYKRGGTVKK